MTLPTYNTNQWRIQGRGLGPPLYLDQIEARKAEKYFFGRPPPSYLRVWMTTPPHPTPLIWKFASATANEVQQNLSTTTTTTTITKIRNKMIEF